jgi:hypothetical protein
MIPGGAIFSGPGAIGGANVQQNPDYGQTIGSGVTLGSDPMNRSSGRKKRYRDAYDAASKFKEQTDYKAEKEGSIKNNKGRDKATMKIAPDISVMEGYEDPGFTLAGQKGTRGGILGTVGSAVGGYFGGPLGGQIGGAIGSSFG